jgi:hypothetical protein
MVAVEVAWLLATSSQKGMSRLRSPKRTVKIPCSAKPASATPGSLQPASQMNAPQPAARIASTDSSMADSVPPAVISPNGSNFARLAE